MTTAAATSSTALGSHNKILWSGRPPEQNSAAPGIPTHDSESFSLRLQDTDGVAFASEEGCNGEARNAGANYVVLSEIGAGRKTLGG